MFKNRRTRDVDASLAFSLEIKRRLAERGRPTSPGS
jgi:hypothetical protein